MVSISTQDLINLVRPIVELEMPDEKLAFDITAHEIANRIAENRKLNAPSAGPESFGFLGSKEAADVLEYVKLLTGALAFFTTATALLQRRRANPPNLEDAWARALIEAGLSEPKARRIARRFYKQVISRIQGDSR